MTRSSRAVFAGLVRNCAPMLPAVLANLEALAPLFRQSAFLFLENDSIDGSRALLEGWCRGRAGAAVLSPDSEAGWSRVRTVRLAGLRNQIVEHVRQRYADFDVLMLLDCDEVNATPKDTAGFVRALDFLWADGARAGVFANTLGAYYDMWAFRHPQSCPDDIWEATMDHALRRRVGREEAFDAVYAPRMFALPLGAPPLEVDSAFGGLGIYRLSHVLANRARYEGYKIKTIPTDAGAKETGWQICEHVAFHAGLRASGGRLFVLPWLSSGEVEELMLQKSWNHALFDPAELTAPAEPVVADSAVGRNQPCLCGSGRRYKYCHGAMALA